MRYIKKDFFFKIGLLLIVAIVNCNDVFGQDLAIRKIDQAYRDSLMSHDYPYVLPIYGDRVQKTGHDLPLPFGIMVNYIAQDTKLNIDNIALRLDDSEFVDMDFLEFETFENTANVVNVRLEAWLFPFLNVYGLYAHSESNNAIKLTNPFELDIPTNPTADTYGLGTVLAYGAGNYFAILNFNATWSDVSSLDDKVFGTVTSFRVGRSFGFHKRFHNINFSIGAQHQYLARDSSGELRISDMFSKVDKGKIQEIKNDMEIKIPEEIFGIKKWECEVLSNYSVSSFIKELIVRLPDGEKLDFKAGGYIQIDVPEIEVAYKDLEIPPNPDDPAGPDKFKSEWDKFNLWDLNMKNDEPIYKAYSMANHPAEGNKIMLNVRSNFMLGAALKKFLANLIPCPFRAGVCVAPNGLQEIRTLLFQHGTKAPTRPSESLSIRDRPPRDKSDSAAHQSRQHSRVRSAADSRTCRRSAAPAQAAAARQPPTAPATTW